MNNDTNAQLAITTYIRVKVPFSENISGCLLQLPGAYKLLTHLSRKHSSMLLWGICVHGIYQSFRGLIIYSLFSKVNICKLHKSNLVFKAIFFLIEKAVCFSQQRYPFTTPFSLPRTHMHSTRVLDPEFSICIHFVKFYLLSFQLPLGHSNEHMLKDIYRAFVIWTCALKINILKR